MNIDREVMEAHNNIPVNKRRRVILLTGEIIDFIDLKIGDEFQLLGPDNNVEFIKYKESYVSWHRCEGLPYVNEDNIPTIKSQPLKEPPNMR